MRQYYLPIMVIIIVGCCASPTECRDKQVSDSLPEAVLASMRTDTSLIAELDSLAEIAIGEGAICIDPVWHLFCCKGRYWFLNPDWGGVLEIPQGYIPEDNINQAFLSFHGTTAFSPDSLIRVGFYAGFQQYTKDEFESRVYESVYSECLNEPTIRKDEFDLGDGSHSIMYEVTGRNGEGMNVWGRYIFSNSSGVTFSVCVLYPEECCQDVIDVVSMASRYPLGPDGNIFIPRNR